jgi:transposase
MWTLPRIASMVKERFGVELPQPSVWRMLQRLGWSVQRPADQVRERDEETIRTRKEKRWSPIKKSIRSKAE